MKLRLNEVRRLIRSILEGSVLSEGTCALCGRSNVMTTKLGSKEVCYYGCKSARSIDLPPQGNPPKKLRSHENEYVYNVDPGDDPFAPPSGDDDEDLRTYRITYYTEDRRSPQGRHGRIPHRSHFDFEITGIYRVLPDGTEIAVDCEDEDPIHDLLFADLMKRYEDSV